jgi:hypothetical protein
VVIDNLDIVCIRSDPAKADPPLVVHANAVLSNTAPGQLFQTVRWRNSKVGKSGGGIQHDELAKRNSMKVGRQLPDLLSTEEPLGVRIPKAADQGQ